MDNNKLPWGCWCVVIFLIIATAIACFYSLNKDQQESTDKERAKTEQLLHDKFLYLDINSVYHIDRYCYRLNDAGWSEEEQNSLRYSSQYISRDSITDWLRFAATHQLCSECFTPKLILQLDSAYQNKFWPGVSQEEKYDD